MAGLPFVGDAPRHHDAGPPGETLDLPPNQLPNAKTFVVLGVGEKRQMEEAEEHKAMSLYCALLHQWNLYMKKKVYWKTK